MNLNHLNDLRAKAGMRPLKAWKESKAKLEAAIAKLEHNVALSNGLGETIPAELEAAAEEFAKDVKAKKSPKAAVKKLAAAVSKNTVTLVDIAKELDLNPKVARAKMRRIKLPAGTEVSKHTYHANKKSVVIAALEKDHRKK